MSIEDRSLDALKEEGTATVFEESDHDWKKSKHKLYSINETGIKVAGHYLHVDSNGSLKANGGEDSDNVFTVHDHAKESKVVVMLEHDKTKKVVAFSQNPEKVYVKELPEGTTLAQFNNLRKAENSQPDILFYKIPKAPGSELFYLQSYSDGKKTVGFDPDGNPMRPSAVKLGHPESLCRMMKHI